MRQPGNNQQLQAQQRRSEDPHARGASDAVQARVRQLHAVLDDHEATILSQAARDAQQTSAEIFNRSAWIADVSRGTRELTDDVRSVLVMAVDHKGKVDERVNALGAQLEYLELSHSIVSKKVHSLRSEQHRMAEEVAQLPQHPRSANLPDLAAERTTTPEQIQVMVNTAVTEQMHTMVQAGAAGAVEAVQCAAAESAGAKMREAVDAAVKAATESMEERMMELVRRAVADALARAENPPRRS
jgi:hypothetical protein